MYTYLLINFFTIIIPLSWSYESKIAFYKNFKALVPALLITGTVFIIWDVIFTKLGVWGFNPQYLLGIDIINLPIEEWLFFICIPYSCVFTFYAFGYFFNNEPLIKYQTTISWILTVILTAVAIIYIEKAYTATTFLSLASLLLIHLLVLKSSYMGRFYLSYAILMVPFFVVNGILTGSWIEDEVVWYNNQENLGIRLGTIPVEDLFYGMLLILMNVTLMELFKRKLSRVTSQ